MNEFLTNDFNRTGRAGIIIDIGRSKEPGASRAINLDRSRSGRNSDSKGRSNIISCLRFSDISNRWNNKDNPRFNNPNRNNVSPRASNTKGSSNPNSSILNLRASNTRGDHHTNSIRENQKERMPNIKSRRTIANGDT